MSDANLATNSNGTGVIVACVAVPENEPETFFAATAKQARDVLQADEGWPTYKAGISLQSLAMSVMSADAPNKYPDEEPMALYLVWGALTDEMDAPGRGSPEQDAAAVRRMKRAAEEWLTVVGERELRMAYLDQRSAAWRRLQRSHGPVLTIKTGARHPISGQVPSRPAGARSAHRPQRAR